MLYLPLRCSCSNWTRVGSVLIFLKVHFSHIVAANSYLLIPKSNCWALKGDLSSGESLFRYWICIGHTLHGTGWHARPRLEALSSTEIRSTAQDNLNAEHEILGWKFRRESIHYKQWSWNNFKKLLKNNKQKRLTIQNVSLSSYKRNKSQLNFFWCHFFWKMIHCRNFHHFHAARLLKVVQPVIRILRYEQPRETGRDNTKKIEFTSFFIYTI